MGNKMYEEMMSLATDYYYGRLDIRDFDAQLEIIRQMEDRFKQWVFEEHPDDKTWNWIQQELEKYYSDDKVNGASTYFWGEVNASEVVDITQIYGLGQR